MGQLVCLTVLRMVYEYFSMIATLINSHQSCFSSGIAVTQTFSKVVHMHEDNPAGAIPNFGQYIYSRDPTLPLNFNDDAAVSFSPTFVLPVIHTLCLFYSTLQAHSLE